MSARPKHVVLSRTAFSEMEPAEMEAAGRLGARRFRRWANDRILRDLAGKLTAEDMQSLFSPVPFGNAPVKSVMQQAAEPEVYAIWESFISIDMDKQSRVLKKWEEHIAAQRHRGVEETRAPAEVKALRAWAHVSRKARHAMRRAPIRTVEMLEEEILSGVKASGHADLHLSNGFHRLLSHGIAEYHGLRSVSRPDPNTAARVTHVMRPRPPAAAASDDDADGARVGASAAPEVLREIRVSDVLYLMSEFGGSGWHQPPSDADSCCTDDIAARCHDDASAAKDEQPDVDSVETRDSLACAGDADQKQQQQQDPGHGDGVSTTGLTEGNVLSLSNGSGALGPPQRESSGDTDSWVVL